MPDEASESGTRSARKTPSTSIDMDQILEFIRLGNERRSDEITLMAERLAQTLADQLGQTGARGDRLDEGRIRAYDVTRRQLAGPSDDEADTLGIGTIVAVRPVQPPVDQRGPYPRGQLGRAPTLRVGGGCGVLIRNAGHSVQIAFASVDGTVVTDVVDSTRQDVAGAGGRSDELAIAVVPEGAITGPISVVTETGIVTSAFDVPVAADGTGPTDLNDDLFLAL